MFSMEEEGSATRPPAPRASSLSDDEDDAQFICPILHDPSKEICHYLKDLVNTRQLSNSLPKSNFSYKVSEPLPRQRDTERRRETCQSRPRCLIRRWSCACLQTRMSM